MLAGLLNANADTQVIGYYPNAAPAKLLAGWLHKWPCLCSNGPPSESPSL